MTTVKSRIEALEQEQRCKDPFPADWPHEVPSSYTDAQITAYKHATGRKCVFRRNDPFLLEFYLGMQ